MDMDMDMDVDMDVGMDTDLDMKMDTDLDMEMDTDFDMIFCFGSNQNKPKLDLFRSFSRNFHVMGMAMDMDMAVFLLFWYVSNCLWMFWLYRNTKTSCFDIKAKQPKQTSCFGQCQT
jgi:hypothetical protein